ncbi:biotin transporter BioY [Virgibacillus necropolis]|uniref:Biotin transporter n=1 Tax=Virgibacillus necropolis TaxID=163877 RepID=A0A221MBI1_9BACI|nr:biotin transporter BioY [Virgibacillus necropolis]ASN04969.1 BioY family transporter [Virgibacillus necropolis]
MNRNKYNLRSMIVCSMFAAVTAVLAQIEIPLPLVPISGQTLAVGLTSTIIGSRLGAIAMMCYAAIGAVGAPVFAGFSGGLHVLLGPTGGYIFGFIIAAYVIGYILEKSSYTVKMAMLANTIGMVIILLCGTLQLKFVLDLSWSVALVSGVYPFIVVGLIKAFLASWIGIVVRKRLDQANVLLTQHRV